MNQYFEKFKKVVNNLGLLKLHVEDNLSLEYPILDNYSEGAVVLEQIKVLHSKTISQSMKGMIGVEHQAEIANDIDTLIKGLEVTLHEIKVSLDNQPDRVVSRLNKLNNILSDNIPHLTGHKNLIEQYALMNNKQKKRGQPKDKKAGKSITNLKSFLKNGDFSKVNGKCRADVWEWVAKEIKYPYKPHNRIKNMQGYLRKNALKQYEVLKQKVEKYSH